MSESLQLAVNEGSEDFAYEGLEFSYFELRAAMRSAYNKIIEFVSTQEFSALYAEIMQLPVTERLTFIKDNLFSEAALGRRGINVPDGVLIQTSAFGDRRPTLFAVKVMMPKKFQCVWENMNLTFNNEFTDSDVSMSDENAWRAPLPIEVQNAMLSRGVPLESLPEAAGVRFGMYEKLS